MTTSPLEQLETIELPVGEATTAGQTNTLGLPLDPGAPYRDRPRPGPRGWRVPGGGRATNIDTGMWWQGTTTQVCGLFPFAVSSGAHVRGVPIGQNQLTAEPVGLDPAQWLIDGQVSNTGMWIQAQPGIGKSTLVKRMATGLVGFGFRAVIPGDVKGEYSALVEALGGAVYRIGRGLSALNPLDAGPLRAAIANATGTERDLLIEDVRARRLSLLEALVIIVQGHDITTTERRLLAVAVDLADVSAQKEGRQPTIPDVVAVLHQGPEACLDIAAASDHAEYRREVRHLLNTLYLLVDGTLRGMFDRESSVPIDLNTPALSLDISALDDDDDDVVAAAMICSWAWSAALIKGSTLGPGKRRNVFQVQDELWRALRVAPGLVEKSDQITRLNRHKGVVSAQVTHSLSDLEALPTEQDRAKARGMAARNGIVVVGGLDATEVERLSKITPFSSGEKALVTSWAAPPTWVSGVAHPGRGKYLIKSGSRVGLPVTLTLTPTERALYDTDSAWAEVAR